MNRDFKGVWIPRHIWENKEMIWSEKLLFLEIDSLAKNGECFASNEHFADFLGLSTRQIQNLLSALQTKGFVTVRLFYKGNTKIVTKRIIIPLHKFTDEIEFARTDEIECAHMDEIEFARTDEVDFVDSNTVINNTKSNTKKINKKSQKKNLPKTELDAEFDTLWEIYPKKVSRAVALNSYIKARKEKKYTYETIKNGLERYINHLQLIGESDSKYILNGSTFFNQLRFLDEYNVVGIKKKAKNAIEYLRQKYEEEANEQDRDRKIIDVYPEGLPEPFQGF